MASYWIARNGQTQGPYSMDRIQQMVAAGQASTTDSVWTEGMAAWEPLSRVSGIAYAPPPPPGARTYANGCEAHPNAPLILRPSRTKMILLFVLSALFVAGGILIVSSGQPDGFWGGVGAIVFFGLCCIVFAIQLVPGSSFLRLEPDGFCIRAMYREHAYRWADIDSFFVAGLPLFFGFGMRRMVSWNFAPSYDKSRGLRAVSQAIGGADAALPDTYGKGTQELAALMNTWLSNSRTRG